MDSKPIKQKAANLTFLSIKFLSIFVAIILCIGVAGYAVVLPFLEFDSPIHSRLSSLPPFFFLAHTIGGAIALLIVPVQLLSAHKKRKLHKAFGSIYVVAVLFSTLGGYYLALNAYGGITSSLALSLLATLWWVTTLMGVASARKGDILSHRRWMLRSIALTTAAITLRLLSPVLHSNFDPVTAQQGLYWSCWIINLVIIEVWIFFRYRTNTVSVESYA